jgi:predicted Ser/Thr protein kinase/cytochrome c-type biogenesis protein CcmH/NrfG
MGHEIAGRQGHYSLESELGAGAVGIVYRGRRVETGDLVAIKMLRAPNPDPDTRARFEQEARLGQSFSHENVVRIHDHGRHGGRDFLVMEFIAGESLEAVLKRGPVPLERAVAIVAKLARALGAAHRRGIIHRDVKPANVMIETDGRPVLSDFGFAKDLWRSSALTASQVGLGTPVYMAPEQGKGKATPRADIYSLGVCLYQLATGTVPYLGKNVVETLALVERASPTPPSKLVPSIPPALEAIILRCIAKEPADRFATGEELAFALETFAESMHAAPRASSSRRNVALLLVLVAMAVALSLVLVVLLSTARPGAEALAKALELARKGEKPSLIRPELERCLALDPGCVEAILELSALELSEGNFAAAGKRLAQADAATALEPRLADRRKALRDELEGGRGAEKAVLEGASGLLRDFKTREALASLEAAAKSRPGSAEIGRLLARTLAFNGRAALAVERYKKARLLDGSSGDGLDRNLQETLAGVKDEPGTPPGGPLTTSWEPLFGGDWGEEGGELKGCGTGVGENGLGALIRADAPAAERYEVRVELELDAGYPSLFAGVVFGARSPGDFLLAYLSTTPQELRVQFQHRDIERFRDRNGIAPRLLRVARVTEGRWERIEDRLVAFGNKFVPLTLAVKGGGTVVITVDGQPNELKLECETGGRVGVVKFYDAEVSYRAWSWSALP